MNYNFFLIEFIKPKSSLVMISTSCNISSLEAFDLIKPNSFDRRSSVSTSVNDPSEKYKKRKYSFEEFLAEPSEILVGTETEALLNWDTNPYFSSTGKSSVIKYILLTIAKLRFQTSRL